MRRVAVLGANGFIGNRTVEMLHSSGMFDLRAIVRRASAAALPRRFDLDVHVADGRDCGALTTAFQGCDSVVVSVAGDPATIVGVIDPIHRAANDAGVRRLIYLSSASVHGQSPAEGVTEQALLSGRQQIAYNNAKVAAERRLQALSRAGAVETAILRPGIVFGPRSSWIGGWADELLSGEAYLVEGARGVCNAIYVDNLVRAITLALDAPGVAGQAYLLGQHEQVTWRDLYAPIGVALGVSIDTVPDYPFSAAKAEPREGALRARVRPVYRRLKRAVPRRLRVGLRAAVRHGMSADQDTAGDKLEVSMERALLHTARHIPSWARARTELGYEPMVSFQDGLRRSIAWLAFAGYPVALGADGGQP